MKVGGLRKKGTRMTGKEMREERMKMRRRKRGAHWRSLLLWWCRIERRRKEKNNKY